MGFTGVCLFWLILCTALVVVVYVLCGGLFILVVLLVLLVFILRCGFCFGCVGLLQGVVLAYLCLLVWFVFCFIFGAMFCVDLVFGSCGILWFELLGLCCFGCWFVGFVGLLGLVTFGFVEGCFRLVVLRRCFLVWVV